MRAAPRDTLAVLVAGGDGGQSGVGVFVRQLLPRMATALARDGVDLVAVGTRREIVDAGLDGARSLPLPALADRASVGAPLSLALGAALARAAGARALYLPVANRRTAVPLGIATFGTVHDLAQLHVDNKFGLTRELYVRRLVIPALKHLRLVTAVSEATARDVIEHARVPGDRVRVVPNGIEPPTPGAHPGIEGPYLVYPSRLEHPGKNHLRLVEAFAMSRASSTHKLVLPGKDWGAGPHIVREAEARGVQDRVLMPGFVPRDALWSLLAHADAVVVAGLLEGFGLPLAEALSLGRPVAYSSTGALPEIASGLGAAFDPRSQVAIAAALDRVTGNDALRARCVLDGPRAAARFTWDAAAQRMAAVAREVLDAAA